MEDDLSIQVPLIRACLDALGIQVVGWPGTRPTTSSPRSPGNTTARASS
nr:hypothetical protein [Tessaracoccus coleopterorum]